MIGVANSRHSTSIGLVMTGTGDTNSLLRRRWTRWLRQSSIAIFLVAYASLRLATIKAIPLNSDEPQHAHVAWALSRGLAPYRQVFDNHSPLFHMLYAPVLAMLGETPDVIFWLRVAIIPLAVAALAIAAFVGRRLWDRATALWGCVLACALPPYLQAAGEFRSDALWSVLWLAAVAVAVTGAWTPRRAFWFAALVGAAFAASMKTLLLLAGLALAWTLAALLLPRLTMPPRALLARYAFALISGALAIPALVLAWVGLRGGLAAMRYDVIDHNVMSGFAQDHGDGWRSPLMVVVLAVLALSTRQLARHGDWSPLRRWLVPASALFYLLLLLGTWPLLSRQDLLPCIPMLAMGAAAWWNPASSPRRAWSAAALVAIGVGLWAMGHPLSIDRLAPERAKLADVLAMTTDRDAVMDDKGDAIFRVRPFYFALERITENRMERGLIADDIDSRLVGSDTHVVWMKRLPVRDRPFVFANYLRAGNGLQIAGKDLGRMNANHSASTWIRLPGFYGLVATSLVGTRETLDGSRYAGPRWLGLGRHTVSVVSPGSYALVWQPAMRLFEAGAR